MTLISIERNGKLAAKVYSGIAGYVVRFYIDNVLNVAADYYTIDKQDAVATARTIWNAPIRKAMRRAV